MQVSKIYRRCKRTAPGFSPGVKQPSGVSLVSRAPLAVLPLLLEEPLRAGRHRAAPRPLPRPLLDSSRDRDRDGTGDETRMGPGRDRIGTGDGTGMGPGMGPGWDRDGTGDGTRGGTGTEPGMGPGGGARSSPAHVHKEKQRGKFCCSEIASPGSRVPDKGPAAAVRNMREIQRGCTASFNSQK